MSQKRGPGSSSGSKRGTAKRSGSGHAIGTRSAHKRVKKAAGRSVSSARWLERQLNDPYVAAAKKEGYRSRAAFKLIDLDERFGLLKRGISVVDLGAAPGGWTQVVIERVAAAGRNGGAVHAVDIDEMMPIDGAILHQADIADDDAVERLIEEFGGPVDLVLTDMAPPATGHAATDHIRIMVLCEHAAAFAERVLRPGGDFVAKVWQGGAERELLKRLKLQYARTKHAKPPASRSDSSELYLVAQGFRGADGKTE